jgi:hypothetical protein
MYTTLGCWHTLQPKANPHEPPSIAALTSRGFVKWLTFQILLSPGDHAPLLQKAVKIYDVPRPDGGFFPKHIPREAFPDKPDVETEGWHKYVTGQLTQENEVRRLRNSPYPWPYNPAERTDSSFSPNGKLPLSQTRRPSRPSKTEPQDLQDLARRRSSVPDLSQQPHGGDSLQWATDSYGHPIDPRKRNSRSQSAHRVSTSSSQHQPFTASTQHRSSNSSNRLSHAPTSYRPHSTNFADVNGGQPYQRQRSGGHRPHSPSTIDESTGSEASSEASQGADRRKSRGNGHKSLWPPNFLNPRRHSHDASYLPEKKPPLPPRPNVQSHHSRQRSGTQGPPHQPYIWPQQPPLSTRPAGSSVGNGVRFRNHIFDNGKDDAVNSAPEFTPSYPYNGQARPSISQTRPADPPPANPRQLMDTTAPLSRESSGSSSNGTDRGMQRSAKPLHVSTVSGVGGRRYPEMMSTGRRGTAPMSV